MLPQPGPVNLTDHYWSKADDAFVDEVNAIVREAWRD